MNAIAKTLTRTAIFIFCFVQMAFAQNSENVHLHLDKGIYLPGETIWFKAYLLQQGKPSLSTNLYAGLYNSKGSLLQEKQYPIFFGAANGDFLIPDTLDDKGLQLRVFTKRMIASDSNNAYLKIVPVYQGATALEAPLNTTANVNIQIFPEGGNLITGVNNYIVFKNTGNVNLAAAAIVDVNGKLVDSVYFNKEGLAMLQFTPEAGKGYEATWYNSRGEKQSQAFPAAQANGAALHTEINGKKLYYSISKNSILPRLDKMQLTVFYGADVVYTETLQLNERQSFVNNFSVDSFPGGIVNIVLYDNEKNILQKKSAFIHSRPIVPQITIIEKSNAPKGKNVIDITMPDTTYYTLSATVADENFYPFNENAITDELLLSKQSAALYNSIGDEKRINLVMISNNGEEKINNNNVQPEDDDYISLKAHYESNKKNISTKSLLTLVVNDNAIGKQFFTLPQQAANNFQKKGLVFYDSAKIYYQLSEKELSENIVINKSKLLNQPKQIAAVSDFRVNEMATQMYNAKENEVINFKTNKPKKFNEVQNISNVVVKAKYVNPQTKRIIELDQKYATGMFRGLARGYQFNLVDDPFAANYADVYSYILYRVPGISVARGDDGFTRMLLSSRASGDIGGSPYYVVFINEVESAFDALESIQMSQVAYIKVVQGIVIGSSFRSGAGAIYIYLKDGTEDGKKAGTMKSLLMKGYNLPSEFPNPDYTDKQDRLNADYRSTLYWNPYIETDKNERTFRIEFYNNDISKRQVLTLRGFNGDGEIVEVKKVIE